MIIREATIADIPQMQVVRNSVKENQLSDPDLVPDSAYEEFILGRGKGWICEITDSIVGFAFADLKENNIWALFVLPEHEGKGIGKRLHSFMLDWYFSNGKDSAWLSTAPGTRAENFYRQLGWKETGIHGKGETKFEMTAAEWSSLR